MDGDLERKMAELEKRVVIYAGENPLQRTIDAINLATRNGALYRWAHNGGNYEIRWSEYHSPVLIPDYALCLEICDRLIMTLSPKVLVDVNKASQDLDEAIRTSKGVVSVDELIVPKAEKKSRKPKK